MSAHESKVRDVPGVVVSVVAIAIGLLVLREAREFDTLGAVFPRAIAILMMVLAACFVVLAVIGRGGATPSPVGSNGRRLGMFGVMLAWALLLEPLGFLATSLVCYVIALLIANFDRWTPRMAVVYGGAGGLVVIGLFVLFRFALKVPLPSGVLI